MTVILLLYNLLIKIPLLLFACLFAYPFYYFKVKIMRFKRKLKRKRA